MPREDYSPLKQHRDKPRGRDPGLSPASPSEDPKPERVHISSHFVHSPKSWSRAASQLESHTPVYTPYQVCKIITQSRLFVTNDPDPRSAYYPSLINYFYKFAQTRSWANCRHVTSLNKTKSWFGKKAKQTRIAVSKYKIVDKQINQKLKHTCANRQTHKFLLFKYFHK